MLQSRQSIDNILKKIDTIYYQAFTKEKFWEGILNGRSNNE